MGRREHSAETLSRRLQSLPALSMWRAVLVEALEAVAPVEAAQLCSEIVRRSRGGAPYDRALLALGAAIDCGALRYELHAVVYAEARRVGDDVLAQMLLSPQPGPEGRPQAAPIPGRPDITLGERKTLARDPRARQLLPRLLRDPDPSVIAILLGNPYLVEADVVFMAARRPTSAEAQRTIFRSERFCVRYQVQRALVFNPYTPSDLAARLVPLLRRPCIRALAVDGKVAPVVSELARKLEEEQELVLRSRPSSMRS